MKKIIISVISLFLFAGLQAQDIKPSFKEQVPTIAVAIAPIQFAFNTAQIDLDLRIKERQWLTISPRLQFGSPDEDYYYYEAMNTIRKGFGLGLNYRYFPLTRSSKRNSDGLGPFISGGIKGMSTTYDYMGNSYINYTDDYGVIGYTINSETSYVEDVSQVTFEVNIGYDLRIFDILFAEAYLGVGAKYSGYDYDGSKGLNLGENSWDTGYSGYTFTGGIRIGIFLNKYTR
jgi:hypothetical protein